MKKQSTLIVTLLCLILSLAFSSTAFAKKKSKKSTVSEPATTSTSSGTTNAVTGKGIDFIKQPMRIGVGASIGTGAWPISAKFFVNKNVGIELNGPIFGFVGIGFGIVGDVLYEGSAFFRGSVVDLSWQVGGGPDLFYVPSYTYYGYTRSSGSFWGGFHLNGGFQILFTEVPVDLVWSYRPGFYFYKGINISHDAAGNPQVEEGVLFSAIPWGVALSARYYF